MIIQVWGCNRSDWRRCCFMKRIFRVVNISFSFFSIFFLKYPSHSQLQRIFFKLLHLIKELEFENVITWRNGGGETENLDCGHPVNKIQVETVYKYVSEYMLVCNMDSLVWLNLCSSTEQQTQGTFFWIDVCKYVPFLQISKHKGPLLSKHEVP